MLAVLSDTLFIIYFFFYFIIYFLFITQLEVLIPTFLLETVFYICV